MIYHEEPWISLSQLHGAKGADLSSPPPGGMADAVHEEYMLAASICSHQRRLLAYGNT